MSTDAHCILHSSGWAHASSKLARDLATNSSCQSCSNMALLVGCRTGSSPSADHRCSGSPPAHSQALSHHAD
jgi:hypothetical protein